MPPHASSLSKLDRYLVTAALVMIGLLLVFSVFGWLFLNLAALRGSFAPPVVQMTEAYADSPPSAEAKRFDHSAWDQLLARHVDAHGWVDYEGFAQDQNELADYISRLADAPFDELSRDGKLALLINAYNAFTVQLILDHRPIESIRDIDEPFRWEAVRWVIAGEMYSLAQIEHDQIRPKFIEPRIHFALVCAAVSCPKLRNEAYTAESLQPQLAEQVAYTFSHQRWMQLQRDPRGSPVVSLTPLLHWYSDDFQQQSQTVANWLEQRVPLYQQLVTSEHPPIIRWLRYDWSLNDVSHRVESAPARPQD